MHSHYSDAILFCVQAAQVSHLQRETCRQVLDGTSVSHLEQSQLDTYIDLMSSFAPPAGTPSAHHLVLHGRTH